MESFSRLEAQFGHIAFHGLNSRERRRAVTGLLEGVFRRLVTRLEPESVIEIGAHEAKFSTLMRRALPKANIMAFEANPEVYNQYSQRLAMTGVDYRNTAIADAPGSLPFGIPVLKGTRKTTHAGLLTLRGADEHDRIDVDAVTLDSVAPPGNVALWIDVEGALRQVLEGATATLARTLAVYTELDTSPQFSGGMQARQAIEFLERNGFVALARDVQKPIQFNAIFTRTEISGDTLVMRSLNEFYAGLRELAKEQPVSPVEASANQSVADNVVAGDRT